MNYNFKKFFFLLILLLPLGMTAQKKHVWDSDFWGQTIDVLLWDDVEYIVNKSPLAYFNGYKSIFGELTTDKFNPEVPVELEKNYRAKWMIYDNSLLLYDVEVLNGAESYPNKLKQLEKLTKHKFQSDINYINQYPNGVMFASWFSGFIYVKRLPKQGETYCDCMYQCEKFTKLGFRNGKLIHQEIAFSMDVFRGIIENCTNLLREKLSLENEQELYTSFRGHTCDIILWRDTSFMCSISPLSVLDNFEEIYPNFPQCQTSEVLPRIYDKTYQAKWTILKDKLYVYEIMLST
jgi:hypothetical protein